MIGRQAGAKDAKQKVEAVKALYDVLGVKGYAEKEMHKHYAEGIAALESPFAALRIALCSIRG